MADFYFFTEHTKLVVQTQQQAFGAIDENNYRLDNLFSANSSPKAFAIVSGNVLAQEITGNNAIINLVIKPSEQPSIEFPKIGYIIYKGLLKSSLVKSNGDIEAATKNDLARKIQESFTQLTANMTNPPASPIANEILGLGYKTTAVDSYLAQDGDNLDLAFYNEQNTLFPVFAGDYIGDFDQNSFGIMIVFEKIGFKPTFKLARELSSVLTFSALDSTATNAEKFKLKHDKEIVLNFLDSNAFFGAFYNDSIKVYDGTEFIEKTGNDLYTSILQKSFTRNKIYFDLRNDYEDSFNYYENYSNNFLLDLSGTNTFAEIDYYRTGWPILVLDDIEFSSTDKNIKLSLPLGDNERPLLYLKRGYLHDIGNTVIAQNKDQFLETETLQENWLVKNTLATIIASDGKLVSNYYKLKLYKRYDTPDSSYLGLSLPKESYLDNLFTLFDIETPFQNTASTNIKVYEDAGFVDKSNINNKGFTTNIGVAIDTSSVNFIAFPNVYHELEENKIEKLPLIGQQYYQEESFIDFFNKNYTNYKIQEKTLTLETGDKTYLSINTDSVQEPESSEAELTAKTPEVNLKYDLENVDIISFTKTQIQELIDLKNLEFGELNPYKIFLGITNTKVLSEDISSISSTSFVLRGLKEDGNGEVITHEVASNIEVLADQSLYNWSANTETAKVVNAYWVDSNNFGTTKVPYEDNTIRVLVDTIKAIGKKIVINYVHYKSDGSHHVHKTYSGLVDGNRMVIGIECTPEFFQKSGHPTDDNIKEFFLRIKVGTGEFKTFSYAEKGRLKIHVVRFVPDVCFNNGWTHALAAQKKWFEGSANSDRFTVDPELDLFNLSFVKSYPRGLVDYNEIINTLWNNAAAIGSLKGEIIKMSEIINPLAQIPSASFPQTSFGTFSKETISYYHDLHNERMPLIERFYYQSKNHVASDDYFTLGGVSDDLLGTLGSFNWHIAAKGKLNYINNTKMKVTIEKIAIYIKDDFDFTQQDEYLGGWNIINDKVELNAVFETSSGYYEIGNVDYRKYRNHIGKGYDHHRYSEIEELDVYYEFEMDRP